MPLDAPPLAEKEIPWYGWISLGLMGAATIGGVGYLAYVVVDWFAQVL